MPGGTLEAVKETVRDLHRRAMNAVDEVSLAKRAGDPEGARAALAEALELERRAAELAPEGAEPTRSVLYEGAAALALECGELEEAARLAAAGLAGRPSADVSGELERIRGEAASAGLIARERGKDNDRPTLDADLASAAHRGRQRKGL